jgi:hypothetical protein
LPGSRDIEGVEVDVGGVGDLRQHDLIGENRIFQAGLGLITPTIGDPASCPPTT